MKALIDLVNEEIRLGKGNQARARLSDALKAKSIDRAFRAPLAELARRLNEPLWSIRLLNPIVRPSRGTPTNATPREIAEYAAALTRVGAGTEAIHLLGPIQETFAPARLYLAFAQMSHWDYGHALSAIRHYLNDAQLSEYQRLVGKVNLCSALIYEGIHTEAEQVLEELLDKTRAEKLWLLHGNTLELMAANAIYESNLARADDILMEAENTLKETPTLDAFFVKKWKAILALKQNPNNASRRQLEKVRGEARQRQHWETWRDCDRFEALTVKDQALLLRLYFGTPFAAYRERLLRDYGSPVEIPSRYEWEIGGPGGQGNRIDLLSGKLSRGALKTGQVCHRLFFVLCSDFYRPHRLATLYSRVFPGEFFNPHTSFKRVHFAIERLRDALKRARVPLQIQSNSSGYTLHAKSRWQILVPPPLDQPSLKLARVLDGLPQDRSFNRKEIQDILGLSERTAGRFIQKHLKDGTLEQKGSGPATRYCFSRKKAA